MAIWLNLFNFLHFVGLAFGLGGATIMAIVSRKAEKYKEVAVAMKKIGPAIVGLIWTGLILLGISGIAITFLVTWPLNKNILIIKHVLVVFVVLVGIIMGVSMKKGETRYVKIFGAINLVLWYLITLLSVFV